MLITVANEILENAEVETIINYFDGIGEVLPPVEGVPGECSLLLQRGLFPFSYAQGPAE